MKAYKFFGKLLLVCTALLLISGLILVSFNKTLSKIDLSNLPVFSSFTKFQSKLVAVQLDYNFSKTQPLLGTASELNEKKSVDLISQIAGINNIQADSTGIIFSNLPLNFDPDSLKQKPTASTNPSITELETLLIPVLNFQSDLDERENWQLSSNPTTKILTLSSNSREFGNFQELLPGDILILTTKADSYYYEILAPEAISTKNLLLVEKESTKSREVAAKLL